MSTYNPYKSSNAVNPGIFNGVNMNSRLAKFSVFGRSYTKDMLKNSKAIHANEDLSIVDVNGNPYTMFSRKIYALMQERQTIAALNVAYQQKIGLLREYATKGEVRDYLTKMTNEIVVFGKDKKFCELESLPSSYSEVMRTRAKDIFEEIYSMFRLSDKSLAWDICHEWLVDGYICREIIYDEKRKNVKGSLKMDPASVVPIVDEQTGVTFWLQHPGDENNQRLLLDSEIIYISYSGASNFMETSYVEPLIKPYNELKSIERSRLVFNLHQATIHKEFSIPVQDIPRHKQEQVIQEMMTQYKDFLQFDDTTGLMYVDGMKDASFSKEYWWPNNGNGKPEMNIVDPGGVDLNESSQLVWFRNNFKAASKFPLSRLDSNTGGGNVYSFGNDVTNDDFNFDKYVERLRALFKDIILKPVILQMLLEFPELEKNHKFNNDIDIKFYGNSELINAKRLANLQAKAQIASEISSAIRKPDDTPALHYKFIMKKYMGFSDDEIAENEKFWKNEPNEPEPGAGAGGGGGLPGGDGGGTAPDLGSDGATIPDGEGGTDIDTGDGGTAQPAAQAQAPDVQAQIESE